MAAMTKDRQATQSRPLFDDLPLNPSDPPGSAWGLWDKDDELGTLNLLTPEIIRSAKEEIRHGIVVPLSLPLDSPAVPMNPRRKALLHNVIEKGYANDDEIHLNTQASSHWDGLRHYPYQDRTEQSEYRYYSGAVQSDFVQDGRIKPRLGIQGMAQRGVAGRGVLLDWRAYAQQHGIEYSPFSRHCVPLSELQAVIASQGIELRAGDILLIRTGWTQEYNALSTKEKVDLAGRPERTFVGVEASKEMLAWHWTNQFAAVASDTNAYEVWPPTRPCGVSCHEVFLSGWGMPIGELWDLERLAAECARLRRWTFFVTSSPLNLTGGVASPANAMAIL
ncbi:hypothetical protein LTR17_007926 [Elasticomyces elasticus]|nr:hypothetical protein LTR17_007926 [Elasticomyces elasticus]